MISDELRARLEKLNRGPLKPGGVKAPPPKAPERQVLSIDRIAPARLIHDEQGACLLFQRTLAEFLDDPDSVDRPFRNVFLNGRHTLGDLDPGSHWHTILSTEPRCLTFLDIETLGLAGTPVFLVGLLDFSDDALTLSLIHI